MECNYFEGDILVHIKLSQVCTILRIGNNPFSETMIFEVQYPNGRKILYNKSELNKFFIKSKVTEVLYGKTNNN